MTLTLNTTITQRINKLDKTYGVLGDKIILIGNHFNVLVVENKKGERFSVRAENVNGLLTVE